MRKNPDPRTKNLRAKYRAKYGLDWWKDEDIHLQYRAERREIYRNGPPSTGGRKVNSRKSQQQRAARIQRSPIESMATVLGTRSSNTASEFMLEGVLTPVPLGVSITRKDLKTRTNFIIQTDDGQKMVVSVEPSGLTTVRQYTADGDKHFESDFSMEESLETIELYLVDIMVDYGR